VQFSKLLIGPVVALACVSLTSSPVPSQTAAPSRPVLKSAKDSGSLPSTATNSTEAAAGGGRTKERDFGLPRQLGQRHTHDEEGMAEDM
jgi:hypothetical protein